MTLDEGRNILDIKLALIVAIVGGGRRRWPAIGIHYHTL